jgi:CheY-like chemotaxis protein
MMMTHPGAPFESAASSTARRASASSAHAGALAGDDEVLAQAGRRILVADDEPDIRATLAELLRTLGHDVRTAGDGEEALTLARQWQPDVVLLDVFMPRMSGFVVARLLRLQFERAQMRIVMMSGYPLDESALENAGEAGFDACLDKTFSIDLLKEAVSPNPPWSGFGPDFTSA